MAITTLLDALKQRQANQIPNQLGPTGIQSAVDQTLQAKTGKVSTNPVIGQTVGNLTEAQGLEQSNINLAPLKSQAQTNNINLELGQQEQTQKLNQGIEQANTQKQFNLQDLSNRSNQILNQLNIAKDELNTKQKQQGLEQAGFLLAQQDKDYMNQLEYEGKRRRLDNDSNFRIELQNSALGDMYNLFMNDLAFKNMFNSTQREFTRQLSNISLDDAINIARAQIKQENTQGMIQGIGGMASAGAQYYDKQRTPAAQPQTDQDYTVLNNTNTDTSIRRAQ